MAKKIILSISEFKEQANRIHKNFYVYDLVNFNDYKDKINIICPEHGIFEQRIASHLKGKKCRKCFQKNRGNNSKKLIERFQKIHNSKYDYSLVEYIDSNTNVKIICPEHGIFEQDPMAHARGRNCPKCTGPGTNKYTQTEIISKFVEIHSNKYNYIMVEYINYDTKVKIICLKHGIFEQKPCNHIRGNGCPKCINKIEEKILGLMNSEVSFRNREIISPFELDLIDLKNKFAIEFNGILYHSYGNNKNLYLDNLKTLTNDEINKHLYKLNLCKEKEIKLININEIYWRKYNDLISNIIFYHSNKLDSFEVIENLTYIQNFDHMEIMNFNKSNNYRFYSTGFSNNIAIFGGTELILTILFEIVNETIYIDNIVLKSGKIIKDYINTSINLLRSIFKTMDIYFFNYNDLEVYSNKINYLKTLQPNEYYTSKKLKKLKIVSNSKTAFIKNIDLKYKSIYTEHSGRFYYDTGWDVYLFKKDKNE